MANQLAPFNRDLATALQPLRPLLQKNAQPFHMNDEQTLAFKNAKAILISNNVIAYLLVSDDGFVLKGTRLLIPHELRQSILSDLHASHRGIEGTKARARLINVLARYGQRHY